jgi:hypothetical protein
MKSKPKIELAEALVNQDTLMASDYANHRREITKSLEKLRSREQNSRWVLLILAATYVLSVLMLIILDRLPRDLHRQGWHEMLSTIVGFVYYSAAVSFPILLLLYLLRHLPNWWFASRNRHEELLIQLLEERRSISVDRDRESIDD